MARALADAFCAEVNGTDFLFGFFVFQNAFLVAMCLLVLVHAWVTVRPSGLGPVGQGFPSPLPTLPPVRYLAYSGQPVTHSDVTVSLLGDETKRRVDTHSTATRVFELALHRSAGACAKLEACLR